MANYYNINRSLETYELRLIDPDDGQLKSIFDIPSIGSSGGQGGYTDLEIDNLVNAKLNIDNPDVNGTLRAGAGGSGGKIIINAGSTPESESFYVNGLSTFNGTVKVPVLEASSNIKTTQQVQTNTFNTSAVNTKISFNDNDNEYMKYENSVVDATFNGLKVLDNLYTMDIYPQSIRLPYNNKISFIDTDGATDTDYYNDNYINITIDGGIQRINQVIMGNGEHRFYCGDITTADDGDLVMKLSNTRIDIYKDLYLNDTLFQQGGGGGGGSNSGTFNEDVVIADTYQLKTDTISSNGLNDLVFNVDTVGEFLRFQVSDNTVRVPNTRSFLSQDIYSDNIRPLTFSNDVVFNGGNSTNDAYEEYMRLDASDEKVSVSKNVEMNEDLIMKSTKVLYLDATSNLLRYITSRNDNGQDILELVNNKATNNQIRFTNNGSTSLIVDNSFVYTPRQIQGDNGLKVDYIDTRTANANFDFRRNNVSYITFQSDSVDINQPLHLNSVIDTINDSDLVFNRNNVQFMRLDKFTEDVNGTPTEIEAIICSKQLRANSQIRVNNLQINQFSSGVQFADIRLENADSVMRFYVGNSTSANFQMTNAGITLNRETTIGNIKTNTIDTNGDTDLIFRRNGTEYFRLRDLTNPVDVDIVSVADDKGLSTPDLYTNEILNRSWSFDTVYSGSNAGGTARVEYMRWNYTDQSLDFNVPIDNTNIAVIGNIVDTTVSDERLKTNIQEVESNYCECVKNVKIKTFEYKDEKYKDSDKYGFIAQHLRKHLPKEFDNIVKETKPKKDEGEAYLSINYMKLSVVLWGALQETLNKVEHLEASVYELQNGVKNPKQLSQSESSLGRSPKPKAKVKAKTKNLV